MTETPDLAVPLDELLTQAATGPLRRILPGSSGLRMLEALAQKPGHLATHLKGLTEELGRIASGSSEVAPARGDRRFTDPAWSENPALKRIMQAYLATAATADDVLHDTPLEWRDFERMQLFLTNFFDAVSPSNNPMLSPAAWKALIDSGGANILRGSRNLIKDMASAPRVPTMVDPDAFTVGGDLGVSPGVVVHRTEMFELIQYAPQTETVYAVPLLIIPPTINKFYVLDLAPGRSLVEYLVQQGQQVFLMSWRNPDARHSSWGFNEYSDAILDAFDVSEKISASGAAHVVAACSGGLLASLTAAQRAAAGEISRLASLSLLVTMIDQTQGGAAGSLIDERNAKLAIAQSARKGYLDGRNLAEIFAWLRPNDLIWNYWVNNYLQGKNPPKFDILFWNADTTRMTAQLHREFVEAAIGNKLATPGEIKIHDVPIDLKDITVDSYVVAGSADHICPWPNCYRSAQLLGGNVRFILSTNGHIAALVNPPSNPKSSYQVSEDISGEADVFRENAELVKGSWWPDYAAWLQERSGERCPAPETLGNADYAPLEASPGTYVHEK